MSYKILNNNLSAVVAVLWSNAKLIAIENKNTVNFESSSWTNFLIRSPLNPSQKLKLSFKKPVVLVVVY